MRRVTAAALVLTTAISSGCTSTPSVPYKDPNAVGTIGLCDAQGNELNGGTVGARPFVWRAVGTSSAPGEYAKPGRTATLFGYQPRKGVAPKQWSGKLLSAAARYTNAAHPMSQLTAQDEPLSTFVDEFPPQWKGTIQLRLYLAGYGLPQRANQYDALDIHVAGNRWSVIKPTAVNCKDGDATSVEDLLLTPSTSASPTQGVTS